MSGRSATNHLGPLALTNVLLPRIKDRVVTVASDMHRLGHLDVDDLNWRRRRYRRWRAYSQSKLANLLFTAELSDGSPLPARQSGRSPPIPGWAATNLQCHTGNPSRAPP